MISLNIDKVHDEMEWCSKRGSYLKNKKIIRNIDYDDIIDIFGTPSRVNMMIQNSETSILSDDKVTSFEKNKKYHIEWHCKCNDKYFMVMGWKVDNYSKTWNLYYSDECRDVIEVLMDII